MGELSKKMQESSRLMWYGHVLRREEEQFNGGFS